jgi:uncharacterized membrane protein
MTEDSTATQEERAFRAVLHQHRSLPPEGFVALMVFICFVSIATSVAFFVIGAWPVLGFYGLDVLAIYVAFKLNYRAAKAHEVVEVTPEVLKITQVAATGKSRTFDFNPYWARVRFSEWPDGRAFLKIASHGKEFEFGTFLNPDEKKDFAKALENALSLARAGSFA